MILREEINEPEPELIVSFVSESSDFVSLSTNNSMAVDLLEDNKNESILRYLVTNARSLAPKIMSLVELFEECKLHFAIVTESWLMDGSQLDKDVVDLEHGTDVKIIYKNRPKKPSSRRKVGGGLVIIYNKSMCNFKEIKLAKADFELVCAQGQVNGINRHILLIGGYIEPRMRVAQVEQMREAITDTILRVKSAKRTP